MYNSQLNLWIRVASLNKGRWRHKMGVLLGKVRMDLKLDLCFCSRVHKILTIEEIIYNSVSDFTA